MNKYKTILLPQNITEQIDHYAKKTCRSRSGFVAFASLKLASEIAKEKENEKEAKKEAIL